MTITPPPATAPLLTNVLLVMIIDDSNMSKTPPIKVTLWLLLVKAQAVMLNEQLTVAMVPATGALLFVKVLWVMVNEELDIYNSLPSATINSSVVSKITSSNIE